METKANYVIVGAFTLLVIFAGFGFFLWLAKVQIDKTYTQYDLVFDQVGGLAKNAPVTFNGVAVGRVLTIDLDRIDPSKVRVRIEVSAATPVRQGTEATLSSQGVTGVSFIGLDGGGKDAARLPVDPITEVAQIPTKPTVVQGLLETAPDLLNRAISVLGDIGRFTTQENADHVASIVANLDEASGRINKVVDDLTTAADSFSAAANQVSDFANKLDGVAENANTTITEARTTITDTRKAIDTISGTLNSTLADVNKSLKDLSTGANATMSDARKAMQGFNNFATTGLPEYTALGKDAQGLVSDVQKLIARIERDPARFFLSNRTPNYTR